MASKDYEQYQGRILRVDLSRREIKAERVDAETLRQCLGGACLEAKLLYDEVPRVRPHTLAKPPAGNAV